ncbi:MAG: alpha/beta hydrolase [Planctomycetes bacterium]|nr:alpha/beta hydrolase [Planctomycetota bacterium]MCB9885437.1 alpha/beta hydrolase [Planctomycetota bacterium]
MELGLYFATNRRHEGKDRWHPTRYGRSFSADGMENLRFGWLELEVPDADVERCLAKDTGFGPGDGEALSSLLATAAKKARIDAYEETLDPRRADTTQKKARLGSKAMFADLQKDMLRRCDALVYVHGFNVSWEEAVGSALALQLMLNRDGVGDPKQQTAVVLFTWPSDGLALPFVSYKSDRTEAKGSGYAFARGLLKLRDHLAALADRAGGKACPQDLHLLCHSMGNYVLQNALERMRDFTPGTVLPRLFEQIFLCAPDVDADVFEPDQPMADLHQLARQVTVYHNTGDVALHVSDYTKGNPERLGSYGAARAAVLPDKVQQVDCSDLVGGFLEHSYYLDGRVNDDILQSIDGVPQLDPARRRQQKPGAGVRWLLS